MVCLPGKIFARNVRRNLQSMIGSALALCFAIVALSFQLNYEQAQFENAYRFGGRWDLQLTGVSPAMLGNIQHDAIIAKGIVLEKETAQLDPLTDQQKAGPSAALADHWLLSIKAGDKQAFTMLPDPLLRGRWPESPDEIALPISFTLNSQYVRSGELDIGDSLELPIGIRQTADGQATQSDQLTADEMYEPADLRRFVIVGVFDSPDLLSGRYVTKAYSGYSDGAVHGPSDLRLKVLISTTCRQSGALLALQQTLSSPLAASGVEITVNPMVANAMRVLETADITRAYQRLAIILTLILFVLSFSIIFNHQVMLFRSNRYQIALLRINGSSISQMTGIFVAHALLVASGAAFLGIGMALALSRLHQFLMQRTAMAGHDSANTIYFTSFNWRWVMLSLLVLLLAYVIAAWVQVWLVFRQPVVSGLTLRKTMLSPFRKIADAWPSLIRSQLRMPWNAFILILTLVLSISVLGMGITTVVGMDRKVSNVLEAKSYDLRVIKALSGYDRSIFEQVRTDLPEVELIDFHTIPIKLTMPIQKMSPEFQQLGGPGTTELRIFSELMSVNEAMFRRIAAGTQLKYDDFQRSEQCILTRDALVSTNFQLQGRANTGENVTMLETATIPEDNYREIAMHTFATGESIRIQTPGKDSSLEIGAVIAQGQESLIPDLPYAIVYVPDRVFQRIVGPTALHNMLINIYSPQAYASQVKTYLSAHQDQWQAIVDDHITEAQSAAVSRQIMLVYIASIMLITVLLSIVTAFVIFALDDWQRRRENAIRICLGQSRRQFFRDAFEAKLAFLLISLLFEVAILAAFLLVAGNTILGFYHLTLPDVINGLTIAVLLHVLTFIAYQVIETRAVYAQSPAVTITLYGR